MSAVTLGPTLGGNECLLTFVSKAYKFLIIPNTSSSEVLLGRDSSNDPSLSGPLIHTVHPCPFHVHRVPLIYFTRYYPISRKNPRSRASSEASILRNLTSDSPDSAHSSLADQEAEEKDSLFPGAFTISLPRIPFITVDTLSMEPSLTPSCEPSPERQSLFVPAPFIPTPVPSPHKCIVNLPLTVPNPALVTLPATVAPRPSTYHPTSNRQPVLTSTMSSVFRMPLRGAESAPKFDGTPACLVPYFEEVKILAGYASLDATQTIKAALRYAPTSESEIWVLLPTAAGQDWNKFVKEVKAMYPGCESDRRFSHADLETLCSENARVPMRSQEELGQYYREFFKISQHLITNKWLADLKRDRLFLEGIHTTANTAIKQRLEIQLTSHHPEDPYTLSDVYAAAIFLLPSITSTAVPLPSSTSRTTTSSPAYPPQVTQSAPVQQPSQGIVVKQEYNLRQNNGCYFCGGDHFARECQTRKDYVLEGKVKWNEEGKLVMPDGHGIPYRREDSNFQQRIDRFRREGPASGANATVLGSMFVHALPSVESTLGIDSPAFMHTCASHDEENQDSEDEELKHLELEVVKAREAFATVKADRATRKTDKGKSVRFDGVELPARAKPGPSSKTTDTVEEVIPPQPANPSSTQYRYSFPLEDKDADKHVVDHMLDSNISIPMRDLITVSTDIRKVFKDMTTTKRVTIGALSVNELSSTPEAEDILRRYDGCLRRSDNGRIVAEHFELLHCVKAVTHQGWILTCVLDQGAECIVMPRSVWQSLGGIPLRPDHKLVMDSVNTSRDETLGIIENLPLDFGTGEMLFQVQVVPCANFEILLGRPFFTLTSCKTEDLPSGEQDITLMDPNTVKVIRIPTDRWLKKCPGCINDPHDPRGDTRTNSLPLTLINTSDYILPIANPSLALPARQSLSLSTNTLSPQPDSHYSADYIRLVSTHSDINRASLDAFSSVYLFDETRRTLAYTPVAKKVRTVLVRT
ncbi:hypothetical protein EV424DRAFT_1533451 [Suillus variegatus]|nr:hypothetical protein EV424DRAFT_1533451 [Suillus variegatus]